VFLNGAVCPGLLAQTASKPEYAQILTIAEQHQASLQKASIAVSQNGLVVAGELVLLTASKQEFAQIQIIVAQQRASP